MKESVKTAVVKAKPVTIIISLWLFRFIRKYNNDAPTPMRITKYSAFPRDPKIFSGSGVIG